jgi:hypothetical protein
LRVWPREATLHKQKPLCKAASIGRHLSPASASSTSERKRGGERARDRETGKRHVTEAGRTGRAYRKPRKDRERERKKEEKSEEALQQPKNVPVNHSTEREEKRERDRQRVAMTVLI